MNNNYITVTEVNKYIKEIVNEDLLLKKVYLKGEISNFKAHSRGHYYFTLKDENSRIAAVMFSFNNRNLKFVPYDGMKVLVSGKIDVYEASGSYQIYVEEMAPDGIGELYVAFEQLKEKLSKEGLFDKDKKKKVRRVPNVVGIVTSPTGAAIRDILTTIKRRYPVCKTILFPALVQGDNAALDIAKNNIKKYQVDIKTYLSDGLNNINDFYDTIVIAGMGTHSIIKILNDKELPPKIILASNNDYPLLRKFMNSIGYYLEKELVVLEKDKYYIVMLYIIKEKKLKKTEILFGKNNNLEYYQYLYGKNLSILKRTSLFKKIQLHYENIILKKLIRSIEKK